MRAVILACFFTAITSAQSISGRVFDRTGGVVTGARVVLLADFNKITEMRSGDSGEFAFRDLKPGTYQVQVKQPRFQIFQQLVNLEQNPEARVYATLNVARADDMVAINSGTPLPPRAEGSTRPYRAGGKVTGLRRLSGSMPAWPDAAKARGAQGTVVLSGVVKTDGSVADIVTLESPDPDLEKAAASAFATWKFEPMKLNGQPVESQYLLRLEYGRP